MEIIKDDKSLLDTNLESCLNNASENFINRIANSFIDFFCKKREEALIRLGSTFLRYLANAEHRYNQVKTLATGSTPRSILGEDSIYVEPYLSYKRKIVKTTSIEKILKISRYRNILIMGSGGSGKSLLMRYLFLDAAKKNKNGKRYVPILLDLRGISNQSPGNISVINLIYECMDDFDVELPKRHFEYSLRLGMYIFLLDGLDEIKSALLDETIDAIQKFCSKYPDNPCIVTSRPIPSMPNMVHLETFTIVEMKSLNKEQAVSLASKLRPDDKKAEAFCHQLEETFFDDPKYTTFAENPLLLSMMFLTFMRNNSLPDHLVDFYQKTYDALYSVHDANKVNGANGFYKREFKSAELDESSFKLLFSRFCFETYFSERYELSEDNIKHYLERSVHRTGLKHISVDNYLIDLQMIVCMIIAEGSTYRFVHRSFQTFFAAYYTSLITDKEQKALFKLLLSERDFFQNKDYFDLLFQLQSKRFLSNAVEETLRELISKAEKFGDSQEKFFSIILIKGYLPGDFGLGQGNVCLQQPYPKEIYERNVIKIFKQYISSQYYTLRDHQSDVFKPFFHKMGIDINLYMVGNLYSKVIGLSNEDQKQFYSLIYHYEQLTETIDAIHKWLSSFNSKSETRQLLRLISKL